MAGHDRESRRRLLADALGAGDDAEAWHRAWHLAVRSLDDALQDELLAACPPEAVRERLAPSAVRCLEQLERGEGALRTRARTARRLAAWLRRMDLVPYVCRTRQWGSARVLHLGLCGATRHMTLSDDSARWDLVRGALCRTCRRRLEALADSL